MEFWLLSLCCLLAVVILFLLFKVYLIKKSAREIKEKLAERLATETNILIDISSSDRDMRNLAECLNVQLRQLREERRLYQQGDMELKEAVTNISHDLRTPLTAIYGYLELLGREEKSETIKNYLSQIENRTNGMKQLTEELFRYSIVASIRETTMDQLCLNSVLEESIASLYGAIVQHGITPEIEITDIPVQRILNPSALTRVFENILSNALKYSDGDLLVRMTEDGVISFSNTAKALDAITVGRLFDRFYTVESGRNSTGLGLSIAKLLTERMGGTICAAFRESVLEITLVFPDAKE